MSSRRTVRHLLVAVLAGVLVGGGLMAVTPAGAEISSAVATNWKKIWNKELKPQADKRYYTKKKSDKRFQPKGSYETAGSGYTKAETYSKAEADAKYQPKGNYALNGSSYTKAESDGKYVPTPVVVRGVWAISSDSASEAGFSEITYPQLATAPTVRVIPVGGALPAGCAGSAAAPDASPVFLCVFESSRNSMGPLTVTIPQFGATPTTATAFGTTMWAQATGATAYGTGTYALRPSAAGFATGARVAPEPTGSGDAGRP